MRRFGASKTLAGLAFLAMAFVSILILRDLARHALFGKPHSWNELIFVDGQQMPEWQACGLVLAFAGAAMGFITLATALLRSRKMQPITLRGDDSSSPYVGQPRGQAVRPISRSNA